MGADRQRLAAVRGVSRAMMQQTLVVPTSSTDTTAGRRDGSGRMRWTR